MITIYFSFKNKCPIVKTVPSSRVSGAPPSSPSVRIQGKMGVRIDLGASCMGLRSTSFDTSVGLF